jgi:hypothetical protein
MMQTDPSSNLRRLHSAGGADGVGTTWWANLPGLYEENPFADRVIALTCATRVQPLELSRGAFASSGAQRLADQFLRWLEEPDSLAGTVARRIALCMACDDVSEGARGHHMDAAKSIETYLLQGATTFGRESRWSKAAG